MARTLAERHFISTQTSLANALLTAPFIKISFDLIGGGVIYDARSRESRLGGFYRAHFTP